MEEIILLIKGLQIIGGCYSGMKALNKICEKFGNIKWYKKIIKKCISIISFSNNNFLYLSDKNKKLLAIIWLHTYIENNEIHLRNDIQTVTSGELYNIINSINISKKDFYINPMFNRTDINYFTISISKSFKYSLEKYIYINKLELEKLLKFNNQ